MSQGARIRVVDRSGRKVRGIYVRDGVFSAGFQANGKWCMKNLLATSLIEAKHERQQIITKLRERKSKRKAERQKELDQLYADARRLAQQVSMMRDTNHSPQLSEAEGLTIKTTDLLFDAWRQKR